MLGEEIIRDRIATFQMHEPQATYTRIILSSADVSHGGYPIIYCMCDALDVNLKITDRPCKVGVFMCRSLFLDLLYAL